MGGIVNVDDDADEVPQPAPVQTVAPEYQGVVVDTRFTPESSLLVNLSGRPWTLDSYFSQVIDLDSQVKGQYTSRSGVYEAWHRILNLELRVESPLQWSQQADDKVARLSGSSNVFAGAGVLIPNKGDMFVADAGDGKAALFMVTTSERKSIFKQTAYLIEYLMVSYVEEDNRFKDLCAKTVNTSVYVRDFNMFGQNPLLTEKQYLDMKNVQERYREVLSLYLRSFFSSDYKVLLIPGQESKIYDHFLECAFKDAFGTHEAEQIRYMKRLNTDGAYAMKTPQLWEAILKMDADMLPLISDRMGFVGARLFPRDPMMEGVYHSGIDYVVYPKNPEVNIDYELARAAIPLASLDLVSVPSRGGRMQDLVSRDYLPGLPQSGTDVPLIHLVTKDDYYVLSEAFYTHSGEMSALEVVVWDALKRKAPNWEMLLRLCNACHGWGQLERFYYIPIVLLLMKSALRSI